MTKAASAMRYYREAPDGAVRFVREVLHAEPDDWHIESLIAYQSKKPRTVMKACKGPGKTAGLAFMGWHFLSCFPDSNAAATSISKDNLQDGLWKEMAKWQAKSPFLQQTFQWTKTRIVSKERPAHWWMSARTWAKSADAQQQANTLAGLHADYMLFLLDETGAIPEAIMATAEAVLASGKTCRIVQAGNPTNLEGPLYRACTMDRALWNVIEVTGDPDDPKRSKRVSQEWARQQIEKYGRDSPWVQVNVFGNFPASSLNTLLGPEEVMAAMKRHLRPDEFNWAQKRIGVDVARFGDDRTVIFARQGLASFDPIVMNGVRTTAIAARVANGAVKFQGSDRDQPVILVDDTGHWGHGVIDNLHAAGYSPIGLQYHGPAIDPRYRNKRAEMWIQMAEWVKGGGALSPNFPELVGELTTPTYTFVNGKFMLEPKEQVKERLGRSPDLADALANTFALPEMPGGVKVRQQSTRQSMDFDPYEDLPRQTAIKDWDPYRDTI